MQKKRREYWRGTEHEKICDELETVRKFTYLGERVQADGGCDAAMTARRRCVGIGLGSVVSCCMADFLKTRKGLFIRAM